MLVRSGPDQRSKSLKFFAWGWAMIAVILLSSAPTSAQPRTRLAGSAFDPATTAVVISPKRTRPDAAVKTSVPTPPKKVLSGLGDVAIAPPRAGWMPEQAVRQWVYAPSQSDEAGLLTRANQARAPPSS